MYGLLLTLPQIIIFCICYNLEDGEGNIEQCVVVQFTENDSKASTRKVRISS